MQTFEDTPPGAPGPSAAAWRNLELVVAVAANGVIGRNNGLPWHLPPDLRHFRRLTTGHAIIMGRKTWEAIGRPLPERQNIVLTRRRDLHPTGAETAASLDDAMALVRLPPPVFCIGGAEIFRDTLARAHRLHVTHIAADFEGDTYFPPIDSRVWRETARDVHRAGIDAPFDYAFVTYDRAA